jgi:Permuted papain-like amidase enzyme, YaeF/YiiX, C92 family
MPLTPAKKVKKMKSVIYKLKKILLTVFGDIKIFKWPFFLIYQPTSFRIKGSETRCIIATLAPGDVVMRAYDNYLDGYFIPKGICGCSHSGLYIGEGIVVHSIAEGSQRIDIMDFCRADTLIILRPDCQPTWAIEHANKCADASIPYDFDFKPGSGKYYCHEFTASCYPHLEIKPLSRKVLGFLSSPTVFLADSFYTNKHFRVMYK